MTYFVFVAPLPSGALSTCARSQQMARNPVIVIVVGDCHAKLRHMRTAALCGDVVAILTCEATLLGGWCDDDSCNRTEGSDVSSTVVAQ